MQITAHHQHSIFFGLPDIEYFQFEEDFVEQNIRCIPMIVRFNMDAAGIKLKLSEWSRFNPNERIELATRSCNNAGELSAYTTYLAGLVRKTTGREASTMSVEEKPLWRDTGQVPEVIEEKAKEFGWDVSLLQWKGLTNLQRFALLKLCRPGHENKNFPRAMTEFGLAVA